MDDIESKIAEKQKEIDRQKLEFEKESKSPEFQSPEAYASLIGAHRLDMTRLQSEMAELKKKTRAKVKWR